MKRDLSPIERAILRAVIDLGDEAYGAPINKAIAGPSGRRPSYGGMYYHLGRLEDDGFIRGFDVEGDYPERGGRARRYYRPVVDLEEVLRRETDGIEREEG